jgi:hypothetical protein
VILLESADVCFALTVPATAKKSSTVEGLIVSIAVPGATADELEF